MLTYHCIISSYHIQANVLNKKTHETPLHTAAIVMDLKICTLLLSNGADVNVNTRKKETPLNYAMKSGDEDVIELLSPAVVQKVERHITRMGDFGEEISSANLIADDDDDEDEDEMEDEEMEMNSNENGAGITDKDIPRSVTDSHSLQPPGPGNVAPLTSENTQKILADVSNILSPALSPMVSPVISPAHSNRSDKSTKSTNTDHLGCPGHSELDTPSQLTEVFSNSDVLYEQNKRAREQKLKALQVARKNPFCKMKRPNTQVALLKMHDLKSESMMLPKLEAWLQKKTHKRPRQWHRRWVIVKDGHFLWNDKQRTIKDAKNAKERQKFHGSLSLMMVQKVEPVLDGKKKNKFKITAKSGTHSKVKDYLFKAPTEDDRDHWVKSLTAHVQQLKQMVDYLGLGKTGK